jgi:hypothetical protein
LDGQENRRLDAFFLPLVEETERKGAPCVPANLNQKAVRSGDWKLISDRGHIFLFNVRTDLAERQDLFAPPGCC